MAWIKMRTNLWEDPRVVALARRLHQALRCAACAEPVALPVEAAHCLVLGALYRTWALADGQSVDGVLPHYGSELLDHLVGWAGWAGALVDIGWLQIEAGKLVLPRFTEHNGTSAKSRSNAAKRQQKCRASVTPAAQRERDQRKIRVREEKEEKTPLPPVEDDSTRTGSLTLPASVLEVPIPAALREDARFRAAWLEYLQHRLDSGSPFTRAAAKRALARLEDWGPARALAALVFTMGQGWLGIREEEGAPRPGGAAGGKGRDQARQEVLDEWLQRQANTPPG